MGVLLDVPVVRAGCKTNACLVVTGVPTIPNVEVDRYLGGLEDETSDDFRMGMGV